MAITYALKRENGEDRERGKNWWEELEARGGVGGGGTPYVKGMGMLVGSLRGVNFGFWSHLGCS